ncbi:hypothetical protein NEUTE2DRAFT_63576 [Neurospora tetrasperma FGSC 2509]|nr:hypothetical protein NEUTE2DRAFT_63576 [Neurospora tetrasperma FGSC 2509]
MPGLPLLPLSLHNGNPRGNGHSQALPAPALAGELPGLQDSPGGCDECDLATLTFHSASNPEPRCLLDTTTYWTVGCSSCCQSFASLSPGFQLSLGAPLGGWRDVHFFQIPGQGHVTVLIEETARTVFVVPVIPFTEPSPISCAWGHVHLTDGSTRISALVYKYSSHKTKFAHSLTVFFLLVITCALLPNDGGFKDMMQGGLEVHHCVVVKLSNIGLLQVFLGLGLVLFRLMMRVKVQWTRLHCGPIVSRPRQASYPQADSPTSRDVMDCDYLMC